MYLDQMVKIPTAPGKITYRTKGKTTYVEYEYERTYDREKQYTNVRRKTIGKQSAIDETEMQPNENCLKFFPDIEIPDRTERSCCLQIGAWVVIRKVIRDYGLQEMLGRFLQEKDVGLFLDLAAYSIIEEDNRAQHYASYAFKHPLFASGMKIYSDSRVSEFLKTMREDASANFLNAWNEGRNRRERIYISYDSTNKKCQAGDLRIVEKGHSKTGEETDLFNYAIAFDTKGQEPLFYELYPGSINDISQMKCMVDRAKGYKYTKIGFILDRGYFSKDNVEYLDENKFSYVIMMKGKADLVRDWVLENKGSFEAKRLYNIPDYEAYGKTIEKKVFATDKKPRYVHLYHSIALEAKERKDVEDKINRLTSFLRSKTNKFYEFGEGMEQYFLLHYDEQAQKKEEKNDKQRDQKSESQRVTKQKEETPRKFVFFEEKASVIELELALCGYFVIITSEKMTAKEALEIYKGRDASEKLFLSDKTFLGNSCIRVDSDESVTSKIFIEFVALIIRNRIYNYLREEKKKLDKRPNFMSVPAAIRELDKIEMARQLDGVYRIDHSVTATQKTILNAFGLTEDYMKNIAEEISLKLKTGI